MHYDFEMYFIMGKKIPHADALSRLKFTYENEVEEATKTINTLSIFSVQFSVGLLDPAEVRRETSETTYPNVSCNVLK